MTRFRTAAVVVAVAIALAVAGTLLMRRPAGRDEQRPPAAPPLPVTIRLGLVAGPPGEASLLTVRLFNQSARQAKQMNDARAANRSGGAPEEVRSARLRIGRDEWPAVVAFVASDGSSSRAIAARELTVVRAPASDDLVLGPDETYEVMYALTGPGTPPPGSRIVAVLTYEAQRFESNAVTVAAPPDDRTSRLVMQARVAQAAGDVNRLLQTADVLIGLDADLASGHWYRGLALEERGDRAGALAAYEAALLKMGRRTDEQEAPVDLYRRIARLRGGAAR